MDKEFKKVFFGYDIEEVEKRISDLEEKYETKFENYQSELESLTRERAELQKDAEKIKSEMHFDDEFNLKLAQLLSDSYYKSSQMVYDVKTQIDENLSRKTQELEALQTKNAEIKNEVKILLSKLENIVHEKNSV